MLYAGALVDTPATAGAVEPAQSGRRAGAQPESPRSAGPRDPAVTLHDGLYRETMLADPQGALARYESVLKMDFASDRERATALLRIGVCLHHLGRVQEARERFDRLIKDYSVDDAIVRTARQYLGRHALDNPARLLPQDVLLYLELGNPESAIDLLSELLTGTPFQNPIDLYGRYIENRDGGPRAGSSRDRLPDRETSPREQPDRVRFVAGLLNQSFFRELRKISGIAFCLPANPVNENEFLLALLPGASDSVHGFVQAALSWTHTAEGVGVVNNHPIFEVQLDRGRRTPQDALYAGFGDEVVLLGAPRASVEGCIHRLATFGPSLADNPDFAPVERLRSRSLLFCYLNPRRILDAMRADLRPNEHPLFDACRTLVSWDQWKHVNFNIFRSFTSDSLHFAFRSTFEPAESPLTHVFRTPSIDTAWLEEIPASCVASVTFAVDNPADRIDRLLGHISQHLSPAFGGRIPALEHARNSWNRWLAAGGQSFLEELHGVTLGVSPLDGSIGLGALYWSFRFVEAAEGQQLLEAAVLALLQVLLPAAIEREWKDCSSLGGDGAAGESGESGESDPHVGTMRELGIAAGLRVFVLTHRGVAYLGLSREVVQHAAASPRTPAQELPDIPPRTSKLLLVRPNALLEGLGTNAPAGKFFRLILPEIKSAWVATREDSGQFRVELAIPDWTPTARRILHRLAR